MKIVHKTIVSCVLILALQMASTVSAAIDYSKNVTCLTPIASITGAQLSPIDITPSTCANIAVFDINFTSASASFTFDSTTYYNYLWQPSTTPTTPPWGNLGVVADDYYVDNYTAQWLQFKTPSEHTINGLQVPLEVQVYFKSTNTSRQDAMFSYLVYRSKPPGQTYTSQFISGYFNTTTSSAFTNDGSAGPQVTIDLTSLGNRTNTLPQFYRYPGTTVLPGCKNVTWYIYTSPVYVGNNTIIETFRTAIQTYAVGSGSGVIGLNSVKDTYDGGSNINSNAGMQQPITIDTALIERFCYKEFWRNHIPFNYGLWFALGMLVIFFCCQLCTNTNKPIIDHHYKESPLTLHPLYSLKKVSNEIFTRRTRFTVLWMNLTNNAIITAIFAANNKHIKGVNDGLVGPDIFLYGLAGSAIGGTFTYIWGFFLRKYYIAKSHLVEEQAKKESAEADKVEKHEENANFYLYFFYLLTFGWMWGGNLIFVWQMNHINPIDRIGVLGMQNVEMSERWMASFFVSIGLDWIVLDVIHVILGFILPFWTKLIKWRGYMYDDLCHKTYLTIYDKEH